jgi:hypothetical protein
MAMNCREYREAHPAAGPEAQAHLASCAGCRTFAQSWELLRDYPGVQPSPGFFQALRRKLAPRILRFAAAVSAAAAALLLAVVLQNTPPPVSVEVVTDEERELVENLELLQNFELLKTLELVQDGGSVLGEDRK